MRTGYFEQNNLVHTKFSEYLKNPIAVVSFEKSLIFDIFSKIIR